METLSLAIAAIFEGWGIRLDSNVCLHDSPPWFAKASKLIFIQFGVGIVAALLTGFYWNVDAALSVMLGSFIVSFNAWLTRRVFLMPDVERRDIYKSAVFRYVLFIAILLFFIWLGVDVLALLLGMLLTYGASYFFSAYVLWRLWRKDAERV